MLIKTDKNKKTSSGKIGSEFKDTDIISMPPTDKYREGWEKIFGKKEESK